MARSAFDLVSPALERTRRQLFAPFAFGQWWRFAIVGLLAGEMGTGGGAARGPFRFGSPSAAHLQVPGAAMSPAAVMSAMTPTIIAVAAGALVLLAILMLYISCRMRFVLFDSVVDGRCRIRALWRERGAPAFRYFVWQLSFFVLALAFFLILIGGPLLVAFRMGWFADSDAHVGGLVLGGLSLFLVGLVSLFLTIIVTVLTKDFVVPQMAIDDVSAFEGWRRLWSMMRADKGSYVGYVVLKIVLAIASAIGFGILTLIVIVVLLLPIGGVGVAAAVWSRSAGLAWTPMTITLVIVGAAMVIALILAVSALIAVPAIVFFRTFSIEFLADRHPALRDVMARGPESPRPGIA
jgi:hypothetical protein